MEKLTRYLWVLLMLMLVGCQAASSATVDSSPYYTPLPPAEKTRIAQTLDAPPQETFTPHPTPPTQLPATEEIPTPQYDYSSDLLPQVCYPPDPDEPPVPGGGLPGDPL